MSCLPNLSGFGDWALALSVPGFAIQGIVVTNGMGGWRCIRVSADGGSFEVRDLGRWSKATCFVPLPECPSPLSLQSFVANTALNSVSRGSIRPLQPETGADSGWVSQWALLRLLDQFGVVWTDPKRRGDSVSSATSSEERRGRSTAFGNLSGPAVGAEPLRISAAIAPFDQRPRAEEFVVDPELARQCHPREFRLRWARPEDRAGIRRLLESETVAFDKADLVQIEQELQLALRADLFSETMPAGDRFHYSAAYYWVLCETSAAGQEVLGVVGALMFFGASGELWFGYLCRQGSILTEVLLRFARERGFERILVWTTPDNTDAIRWYKTRVAFVPSTLNPRELPQGAPFVCFERPPISPEIQLE